jgi:hypothetical protein
LGLEKQATVRDLLMARSGINHPVALEILEVRQKRPARGSQAAGCLWFYNNRDFNAARSIGRQPGWTSFKALRGKSQSHSTWKIFPHALANMFLSHRASIRPIVHDERSRPVGSGCCSSMAVARTQPQVIPAARVRQSTTAYSQTELNPLTWSKPLRPLSSAGLTQMAGTRPRDSEDVVQYDALVARTQRSVMAATEASS